MNKIRTKSSISPKKIKEEPIGDRIAKAVYDAKKISERIVGYISYDINFIRATYNGVTQRPAKITAIEKAIVGVLLVDDNSTFEKIGTILGLDVINDKAEQIILKRAIDMLRSFKAIEGDDTCLMLTEAGRIYADKGERPDTYEKSFDIYVDLEHPSWLNIKNCIGDNIKNIHKKDTPCETLSLDIEKIKDYAKHQAQDVHYPQNRYLLKEATCQKEECVSYKIYVCFVQSVANNEVRVFVYDDNIKDINFSFSDYINSDEIFKAEVLNNCIKLECTNDVETIILEGENIEKAKSEITSEIKEAELKLIQEETEEEASDETLPKLRKKALYDSLSFEVELQKIFNEDEPDEIWLISPWIRKGAFIRDRGPMIENFLKDENKRVFIAYSEPAINNDGRPMMDEEVEPGIKSLEEQYPNFFYVQLPEFHLKNVIEVKGEQKILFSGSFNVLSFSVYEHQTHIRREEMALAHHQVAMKKHTECQYEFAEIYAERIKNDIDRLVDFSNYKNERLNYFLSIKNPKIDMLFSPIEDLIEEKIILSITNDARKTLIKVG